MAPLWRCWDLTAKLRWSEVIFFPPRILRNTKIGHSSSRIGWDPRDLDGFLGLGKFHFFPPKKKNAPAFFFGNTKKLHGVVWKNCWVFLFSRICFFVQCGFFTTLCGWVKERSSNFGGDPFVCPPKKTNMTMEQPTWQWNMTIFNRGYIGSFMVWFSSQSCRYSFRGGGVLVALPRMWQPMRCCIQEEKGCPTTTTTTAPDFDCVPRTAWKHFFFDRSIGYQDTWPWKYALQVYWPGK